MTDDQESGSESGPRAADLPVPVRRQLAQLVADVLPQLSDLPAALRPIASFVPGRRARLGESAILAALDTDRELRRRAAALVAAPAAEPGTERPPAEVAALAWLTRPEGWADLVTDAAAVADEEAAAPATEQLTEKIERLEQRIARTEEERRTEQLQHGQELADAKEEYAVLRRRLGEARAGERAARAELETERQLESDRIAELEAALALKDRELEMLRARVDELERSAAGERRTAKADRDEVTVRARLLLDTLIEAGAGLRRELGLPTVEGAPGDRVEAALADPATASAGAALTTAARLEQTLMMPRARLIVDGYNVTKTHWPTASLENQRSRLLQGLAPLVARTGAETTVVFDAAEVRSRPSTPAPRGVKVVFSPYDVIADDVIRDLVAAEPPGRVVVVVSDDGEVLRDVTRAGARTAGSGVLLSVLSVG